MTNDIFIPIPLFRARHGYAAILIEEENIYKNLIGKRIFDKIEEIGIITNVSWQFHHLIPSLYLTVNNQISIEIRGSYFFQGETCGGENLNRYFTQ
jgi:hypothetical protein